MERMNPISVQFGRYLTQQDRTAPDKLSPTSNAGPEVNQLKYLKKATQLWYLLSCMLQLFGPVLITTSKAVSPFDVAKSVSFCWEKWPSTCEKYQSLWHSIFALKLHKKFTLRQAGSNQIVVTTWERQVSTTAGEEHWNRLLSCRYL